MFSKILKGHHTFGILLRENLTQRISKITQSGHTEYDAAQLARRATQQRFF